MSEVNRSTQALDWEASAIQMRERSERRAWFVAKVAAVIAVACAAAFTVMVPFYRVVPLPVEVNQLTGDAQIIDVLDVQHVHLGDVVDKHWLTEYVEERERYFWPFLQMDYDAVRAMSDAQALKDYDQIYDGPNALDKVLGPDVQRRIKILSATLPPGESGRAVVRFMRTTVNRGEEEQSMCFLATIAYQYKPKVLQRDREATLNPLGFKVTAYSRDTDYGACGSAATVTGAAAGVAPKPPVFAPASPAGRGQAAPAAVGLMTPLPSGDDGKGARP